MTDQTLSALEELNERSRAVFRQIVESYLSTGDPVGSRTISQSLPVSLSAASVRNVMSDLEKLGLLTAPHTSAGRLPSQLGLRMFVDGLLEVGDLNAEERQAIEGQIAAEGRNFEDLLAEATTRLSGLSHCAGLVVTPKHEGTLKHIEFVQTSGQQGIVILVFEDGAVENRVVHFPLGTTPSAMVQAANYLNARLLGKTLRDARADIESERDHRRQELDQLTAEVIDAGFATWAGTDNASDRALIVRGRANLLEDLEAAEDLERIRMLFDDLEQKNELLGLLDVAQSGEGVRIFIGSENNLFSLSGSSVIVSPYRDAEQNILGVIGVIGPTRLNYARIIPMVDYSARAISRLLTR